MGWEKARKTKTRRADHVCELPRSVGSLRAANRRPLGSRWRCEEPCCRALWEIRSYEENADLGGMYGDRALAGTRAVTINGVNWIRVSSGFWNRIYNFSL